MTTLELRPDHPAALAVHTVNDAMQIAIGLAGFEGRQFDLEFARARILELLADVPMTIAAMHAVNEALQTDLRGLRDEGLCMAREINDMRRERTRLIELVDAMATAAFHRINSATAEYRTLIDINSRLRPVETMRPMGAVPITANEPRSAAAGR